MTYREIIARLESIGVEIDYSVIKVKDLDVECQDVKEFEKLIKA